MKRILIYSWLLAALVSCKDDDPQADSTCNVDMALLKDITWHHLTGTLADLRFAGDGTYYENTTNDGDWSLSNGCDSIYVTRPSNSFYYRILSVTADTLLIRNPVFGDVTYFN